MSEKTKETKEKKKKNWSELWSKWYVAYAAMAFLSAVSVRQRHQLMVTNSVSFISNEIKWTPIPFGDSVLSQITLSLLFVSFCSWPFLFVNSKKKLFNTISSSVWRHSFALVPYILASTIYAKSDVPNAPHMMQQWRIKYVNFRHLAFSVYCVRNFRLFAGTRIGQTNRRSKTGRSQTDLQSHYHFSFHESVKKNAKKKTKSEVNWIFVDRIEVKFAVRLATSLSFNVWWWQTARDMTCSCPLSRTPNTISVTLYSLATNVTPNATSRFPFSSSLPSSRCWWRCTDFVYHFLTVHEIRFLLFISFEISLRPVSFGIFICFVPWWRLAHQRQLWVRVDIHFSEQLSQTHILRVQDVCFSRPNFLENYYCFCLCRKIRPELETIASLAFVSHLDVRSKQSARQVTRKRQEKKANTRKNRNERKYSIFWCCGCCCHVESYYLINSMLFLSAGGLIRTHTNTPWHFNL